MQYNNVFFLYLSMNKQAQKRDLQYLYSLLLLFEMYVVQPNYQNEKWEQISQEQTSPITCPHCGSNQITTGQRGFSLLTGFIGSSKTVNRCGNCGYSWKP